MEINDDTNDFLNFLKINESQKKQFNKRLNIQYHDNEIRWYKIRHDLQIEDQFKQNKKQNGGGSYSYLFHGSSFENWYSIITNGLKNYSNTKNMKHGNSYGSGIYLSDEFSFSQRYANNYNKNKDIILGVYEIIGNKEKYKKSQNIYVIPNESDLLLRFILISNNEISISKCISQYFSKDILYEDYIKEKFLKTKGTKRLFKEYINFTQNLKDEFKLSLVDDDYLDKWYIEFKHNEIGSNIKLYIEFNNFPFEPPFIHIIYPRFIRGTAHITSDGAICMESLTSSGWSSLVSIENLLIQIKTLIIDGKGKIDYTNTTPYTYTNAKKSFAITAKQHGWI